MVTQPFEPISPPAPPDIGYVTLVRALLLVQIGVIVTATVESLVVGLASPSLISLALLNGSFAVATMLVMRGIGRRSFRARKWAIRLQIGWIALAVLDMALAVVFADRGLEPVPVITRILLPVLLIHILRRDGVRPLFGAAP